MTTNRSETKSRSFHSFLLVAEIDPAGIRERIRQARKEAGLTQEELAELIDRHRRTVENFENVRIPGYADLTKIARVLNRPIEWFLHGDQASDDAELAARLSGLLERLEVVVERLEQGRGRAQDG